MSDKLKDRIINGVILCMIFAILGMGAYIMCMQNKIEKNNQFIEKELMQGFTQKENMDKLFEELKNENKELYDSLKIYKDKIKTVIQFKYKKEYITDTVYITKETPSNINVYSYKNNTNDSINYKLQIGSTVEPNWYSLNMSVSDRFTIVTKNIGSNINVTDIKSDSEGQINNVTVFTKKEKKSVFDNFAIGPSITYGYDLHERKPTFVVGVSATYNLLKKRKK